MERVELESVINELKSETHELQSNFANKLESLNKIGAQLENSLVLMQKRTKEEPNNQKPEKERTRLVIWRNT